VVSLHGNREHRPVEVEQTLRLVDEVVLLGQERHPPRVPAAPDPSVHPDVKVLDARLADNTSGSEIALHRGRQVREVRVADRFGRSEAREPAIDVAVVRCVQTDRPLGQKAEDDTHQRDQIAKRAEFRVAPGSHDQEHRGDNRAPTNRPPASRPDEQCRSGAEKEQRVDKPSHSEPWSDRLRQLRRFGQPEGLRKAKHVNEAMHDEDDRKKNCHTLGHRINLAARCPS
jgi:hypothetical protein